MVFIFGRGNEGEVDPWCEFCNEQRLTTGKLGRSVIGQCPLSLRSDWLPASCREGSLFYDIALNFINAATNFLLGLAASKLDFNGRSSLKKINFPEELGMFKTLPSWLLKIRKRG